MKLRKVLNAFAKAAIFLCVLLAISLFLKASLPEPRLASGLESNNNPTFFFLGTSRTQMSISPNHLKRNSDQSVFINLATPSNSFLYSCQEAANLLQDGSGRKVIFIELTALSLLPPGYYYELLTNAEVRAVMTQHLSISHSPEDLADLLFYLFSVKTEIRHIASLWTGRSISNVGYQAGDRKLKNTAPAMLTSADLYAKTNAPEKVTAFYMASISRLETLARQNESTIVFILPLAISSPEERSIDLAVFQQLADDQKWVYATEFLGAMNNPDYFYDASHLNETGSRQYSLELRKFIDNRFGNE